MAKPYARNHPGKFGLFIDWETTGADFGTGKSAERYQGISFGALIVDLETFEEVESLYRELKFDDNKYEWTEGAAKIHGLTREYLEEHGVSREEALVDLLELIDKYIGSSKKITIGGHNISFDIDFTDQLTKDLADMTLDWHHVQIETSALGFVTTGLYKSNDVFQFFGAEKRGEHNALEDARQSLAVARGIRQLVNSALEA